MKTIQFSLLALTLTAWPALADVQADLDAAAASLRSGRNYLVGFPQSTRNMLRQLYLGVDTNGTPSGSPGKFSTLQGAIDGAVQVRTDPVKSQQATQAQEELAQSIAWESLEAMLQGQLIAGNGNLLKGLRVAFPTAVGDGERPGGETTLPVGCPGPSGGGEYNGAKITDLCYARLHFFRGIAAALDFMANDSEGTIRAVDLLNAPPQYTRFNTSAELYDPAFPTNSQNQTTGYLMGNNLDRYGKAIIGIGDHLWRAAYFDRQRAPGGSRAAERQQMLDAAMREMQQGVHAQFLAALPLAATMDEGQLGYEKCRVNQVRVTAATAGSFIDRIRRGEIPKLNDMGLDSSTTDIQQQISLVKNLKADAGTKYSLAETAIWRNKEGENAMIADAQQLRVQFTDNLLAATGMDPGNEGDAPYFGLTTKEGREAYRVDLAAKIAEMHRQGVTSALLTDGSELGQANLQVLRAFADIIAARNRIDAVPQQIRIEEERVGALNGVILGTQDRISAYNLSMGIANSVSVTVGYSFLPWPGSPFCSASFNPGAILAATFQNKISRAQAIQQVEMNDINGAATIRNLLLQQHQYTLDLDSAVAQGQLAIASLNALLARVDRLIENHVYYQTSNAAKWYHDPALIFEQEQAEIEYANSLNEYLRELYVLSQLLAVRWSEAYENPYLKADATPETLGGGLYDDFTQPESIFNVYQASKADNFLLALQAWDTKLRQERQGGQADIQSLISLRQDVFGFSDVFYSTNRLRFETLTDPAALALNQRLFRALLLRNAQPQSSRYWLRLEFPLTYNQLSKKFTGPVSSQPAVILASRTDWNIRVLDMSAEILGHNVAQSSFNTLRVDIFQYGKIEIPKYHPRDNSVYPNFQTFNLPLYYPDPERTSISSFKFSLSAGINGNSGVLNPFVAQIEPTPYCDRYVLLIERAANPPINIENIQDIQLTLTCRSSIPPAFAF